MPDDAYDPARQILGPEDYARVCLVADAVVALYGGGGPPFPICGLMTLLLGVSEVRPLDTEQMRGVYGYAAARDFDTHGKYAEVGVDSTAPTVQVQATLFHETGHVVLHFLPPGAVPGLPYYRRAGQSADPREQADAEADLFARQAMMPAAWVRAQWHYACALNGSLLEAITWMAALFVVPRDWMRGRLHALGLLPP